MYYFVERSLVAIKPKQPFLDWLNKNLLRTTPLTIDALRIDYNSYLIPECAEIEDGVKFVDDNYLNIFTMELNSWTNNKKEWPSELTLKQFWEWFDVEISSTVIDMTSNDDTGNDSTVH
jgi:hypothetical protein